MCVDPQMEDSDKNIAVLTSLHEKNQTARDSALLALGSATLGFTITIFTTIYNGQALLLIIAVWVFLLISILTLLISYSTAAAASDKIILYHQAVADKIEFKQERYATRSRHYFKITQRLNRWSIGAYLIALICFVAFAICNVLHPKVESKVTEPKIDLRVTVEKGALPSRSMLPEAPAKQPEVSPQTNPQQIDPKQPKE